MNKGLPNFFDVTGFLADNAGFRAQFSREYATKLSLIDNRVAGVQKQLEVGTKEMLRVGPHIGRLGGR